MKFSRAASLGACGLILTALGACGGGGSGASTTSNVPQFASATAVAENGLAVIQTWENSGFTSPQNIPTTGTASYDGTIVLNDQGAIPESTLAGGLRVRADFANNANITATAGNFFGVDGRRASGELDLSAASIGTGTLGGSISGKLTGRVSGLTVTGVSRAYDYDVDAVMIFYGPNGEALLGPAAGQATEVGNSQNTRQLTGALALEQ